MKLSDNITAISVCFFGVFTLVSNNVLAQGNGNGNANSNNNSNANTLKWDRHGNQVDNTDFIGTTNASALKFKSDNVERLRITEDGRVGVGVTEPTKDFEVLGNTMLRGDLYLPILDTVTPFNDEEILFLDKNDRVVKGNVNTLKSLMYSPYDGPISLCDHSTPVQQSPTWSNGTSKIFSLCPDVYIGVGTNSPQKLLDIRGTTQTRRLEVGREYSGSSLISGFKTGSTYYELLTLGQYDQVTNNEHVAFRLTNSGQLRLNYKEIQQSSTGEVLSINSESEHILTLNEEGDLHLNYLGQGQALTISSASENRKLLQLENNGLLRARQIKVNLDSWADFVFMKDYRLMPLEELRNYIETNNHLPNVPSEAELQNDGLDIAEMNKTLMEKVEELTLYLLEQEDKISNLQEEIEKLK